MVIGNGLIAKAFNGFADNKEYLFFCSGVSNSVCKDPAAFNRETDLLMQNINNHADKKFIYFSTCSIIDASMADSLYVKHKLEIEHIISKHCQHYYIFRLSNVVGNTSNAVTILNFLYNSIKSGRHFDLWANSSRNLIDVTDTVAIISKLLETNKFENSITNVANIYSYDVAYIVKELERFLGMKGNYSLVEKGIKYIIPTTDIQEIVHELSIDFERDYLARLLQKYYA